MSGKLRSAIAGLGIVVLSSVSALAIEPPDPVPEEDEGAAPMTVAEPADQADVPLRVVGKVGSRPVVVNPKNANQVVAAFVTGAACYARTSTNGGRSWTPAKKLPLPAGMQFCDVPTLFWSTDGTRVYAAYFYKANDAHGFMLSGGAAVSFSLDHGASWSTPVKAIDFPDVNSDPGTDFVYQRLFLAMPLREKDANRVYLLTQMAIATVAGLDFTKSSDRGVNWEPRKFLGGHDTNGGDFTQAIAGGPNGQVLVTTGFWSFPDNRPPIKQLSAQISGNYGRTFERSIIANNVGVIDIDVAFGPGGAAHIVYEEAGGDEICCSDGIRYTRSLRPPYASWSAPVTLGSDIDNGEQTPRAPALAVSTCGGGRNVLHVVWMSNWEGPDRYNVYYTRKLTGNHPWSDSLRISDHPVAQGDRAEPGIAAVADKAIAVWGTGFVGDPFAVWSSRVAPGIPCPQ